MTRNSDSNYYLTKTKDSPIGLSIWKRSENNPNLFICICNLTHRGVPPGFYCMIDKKSIIAISPNIDQLAEMAVLEAL